MENWEDRALGLPTGSVRAIIALIATITMCYLALSEKNIPDGLNTIMAVIIGFYFGQKVGGKEIVAQPSNRS